MPGPMPCFGPTSPGKLSILHPLSPMVSSTLVQTIRISMPSILRPVQNCGAIPHREPLPLRLQSPMVLSTSVQVTAISMQLMQRQVYGYGRIPLPEPSLPHRRSPMASSTLAQLIRASMRLMRRMGQSYGPILLKELSTPRQQLSMASFTLARMMATSMLFTYLADHSPKSVRERPSRSQDHFRSYISTANNPAWNTLLGSQRAFNFLMV